MRIPVRFTGEVKIRRSRQTALIYTKIAEAAKSGCVVGRGLEIRGGAWRLFRGIGVMGVWILSGDWGADCGQ